MVATRPGNDPKVRSYRVIQGRDGSHAHVITRRKKPHYNPSQARDQIGHWVEPASQREHPCHHRCCRGKQVHPGTLPVKINQSYLRSLSQSELDTELSEYSQYADTHEKGFLQVVAELNRREESSQRAAASKGRGRDRRRAAESEHKDEVYRQWLTAEAFTNGYMLNKAGKNQGIDERTLFTGPESRVKKYASPELIEYFESHPRPTRASWFGSAGKRRENRAGMRTG